MARRRFIRVPRKVTSAMRENVPRLKELREDIQRALREASIRPQPKDCYRNAGRLVAMQSEVELFYVEGVVSSDGVSLAHAWVRTADGVDHDITLRGEVKPLRIDLFLDRAAVRERMSSGMWGPWAAENAA